MFRLPTGRQLRFCGGGSMRLLLAAGFALQFAATATPIATAFTKVTTPEVCGSVCIPASTITNTGVVSGGVLNSVIGSDAEFAEAGINLASSTAGVAVGNNIGTSLANASHTDTWFCPTPAQCAALDVPGSFIPVTLQLHVSGFASSKAGFVDLTYTYDAESLLGSTALGQFQFEFMEDPGFGDHASISARASFFDGQTLQTIRPAVTLQSPGLNNPFILFGIDLSVNTFIGGCASSPCDITQGIFTDTQSLSASVEAADLGFTQVLDSRNTFRVSITSDLPLVSADGRTAGPVATAAPEPASWMFALAGTFLLRVRRLAVKS